MSVRLLLCCCDRCHRTAPYFCVVHRSSRSSPSILSHKPDAKAQVLASLGDIEHDAFHLPARGRAQRRMMHRTKGLNIGSGVNATENRKNLGSSFMKHKANELASPCSRAEDCGISSGIPSPTLVQLHQTLKRPKRKVHDQQQQQVEER